MRCLLVAASPRPGSLTERLVAAAVDELAAAHDVTAHDVTAHDVTVLDLHAIGWDPVVRPSDYGLDRLDMPVGHAAAAALATGSLDDEVAGHQRLVAEADLLVLAFPLWWFGMPAILKGWVDRVFTQGFAFGLKDASGQPRKYGDGGLAGTRLLVMTSAGDRETSFEPRGVNGGIDALLFPITHGIGWYTGMTVLEPITVLGVDTPVWQGAAAAERTVRDAFAAIDDRSVLGFRGMLDDYDADRRLDPAIAPGRDDLGVHRRDADDAGGATAARATCRSPLR